MPIYPYSFQLPPLNVQDIPSNGAPGEFLGINVGGVLDWLPVATGGGDMLKSENLSGLANYTTARTNIGLGTTDSPTFANLTLTSPSLSSSAPVTISQTWGTTGTYTAFKVVATETLGAAAASNLLELWSGNAATLKVKVNKLGQLIVPPGTVSAPSLCFTTDKNGFYKLTNGFGYATDTNNPVLTANYNSALGMLSAMFLGWSTDVFTQPDWDVRLYKDGAGQLALRNGAAAQTFNVYGTYTSGTSYERLTLSAPSAANAIIGTNKGSGGGTARGLDLHTDGAARVTITTAGNVGIGTTNPATNLVVQGTVSAGMYCQSGTNQFDGGYVGSTGQFEGVFDARANVNASGSRLMRFGNVNNNNFTIRAMDDTGSTTLRTPVSISNLAPTGSLQILSSGNVGIGTTSPTSKLQVSAGDVEVDTIAKGVILKSPDGTRYRVTVANGGTLSVAAV